MKVTVAASAAAFLSGAAQAQQVEGDNKVLYPDATGLTFNYKDTVDVSLTTNYATPYLYLFCWDADAALQNIAYYTPSDGASVVPVELTSNTEFTGTTCWFNLLDALSGSNTTAGATSPEFSYVKKVASEATFGPGSTSAVASTESSASTTTSVVSTTTSAAKSSVTSSAGGYTVTSTSMSTANTTTSVLTYSTTTSKPVSSSSSSTTAATPTSSTPVVAGGMSVKAKAGVSGGLGLILGIIGLAMV